MSVPVTGGNYHFTSGVEDQIPGTQAKAFKIEKNEGAAPFDVFLVYLTDVALKAIKSTGEIILNPMQRYDRGCYENGPILENSRLAVLKFYPNGDVHLGLRKSLCDDIQSSLGSTYNNIKLQISKGKDLSLEVLEQIKGIEGISEEQYVVFADVYIQFLTAASELNKQAAQQLQKSPQGSASPKKSDCVLM